MSQTIRFSIEHGDIASFDGDVVVLKYAQEFYGADKATVSTIYKNHTIPDILRPQIGEHCYIPTFGRIKARYALFIGVPPLYEFGYQEVKEFSTLGFKILADEAPETKHFAMTIHGVGYGLDETEVFFAQVAGCLDAIKTRKFPPALNHISIIEINSERVKRLRRAFEQNFTHLTFVSHASTPGTFNLTIPQKDLVKTISREKHTIESFGKESEDKPYIFTVMPFRKDMDDVFYYGIQKPAHDAGFLCERIDQDSFTGDILNRIKKRIENATVVIAELSNANPNVYLEVGYAWGKEQPTILLIRDAKELLFDVQGQKCIEYERIKDLENKLTKELNELKFNEYK
ncbi:MAG: hypothetical protein PVF58_05765 [Candidatus Methanofastidiosia archaeon]|jgi:hypothetical protein